MKRNKKVCPFSEAFNIGQIVQGLLQATGVDDE
jgi:hypothetical protein